MTTVPGLRLTDRPELLIGCRWTASQGGAAVLLSRPADMVSINGYPQAVGSLLGGFAQPGIGRELGPEGYAGYLETQSIALGGGSLT